MGLIARLGKWWLKHRLEKIVRRMRKERDSMFKKLAWRFVRGTVYVFLSGLATKYAPILDSVAPGTTASLVGGALLALDKALGIGGMVATPAK